MSMPIGSSGADIDYGNSTGTHGQPFSTTTTTVQASPIAGGSPNPSDHLGDPIHNNWAIAQSSSLVPSHPNSAGGSPNSSGNPAQSSWSLAPPHSSPGTDTSFQQLQKSPSSMLSAVPMYYDPEQVTSESGVEYAQWVQANYPEQYAYLDGSQSSPMGNVDYGQPSGQAQQHVTNISNVSNPSMSTPPMQNHYQFVQSPYSAAATNQTDAFQEPVQGSSSLIPPRISHPPTGYTSRQQGRPVTLVPGYQHPQNQPHFAPPPFTQQPMQQTYPQNPQGNYVQVPQSYFPSNPPDASSTLMASSRDFTFSFPNASAEALPISASNSSYTPSSEPVPLSVSPRSWMGTDDGQPPSASHATTSAAPAGPSHTLSPTKQTRPDSPGKAKNNKRARRSAPGEVESGTDDDDSQSAVPPLRGPDTNPTRLPGACTHCKKLKMKCDFPKGENTCKRCRSSGHQCIVEGRKPRNAPNKREYLLAQIRQKDSIIESLLKQLHNPYLATPLSIASYRMATSPSDQNNRNVIAWLDRLEDSVRTAGRSGGANAFRLDSRTREEGDEESEQESEAEEAGEHTERGSVGTEGTVKEGEHLLPDAAVPLGLIAKLALDNKKKPPQSVTDDEETDDDNVGVANETYFMPGPAYDLNIRANLIEQHSPPDILVHGLVTPQDVDKLFEIFYARLNPHVSVLDPVLHTPATTFTRCPFLFTVVCAVASRYHPDKSEIYPIAMHFAKHAAANALITGWKSVELAQAYILMSVYGVPARRWEEDRGWLYTGLAIRIATDLNLHQIPPVKPTSERQERELINKIRVWMNCYNMDRSTATQFGKPSTIKEDYIVRRSEEWYKMSQYNHPFDIGLCAYTSQLRIMSRFHDEVYSDPTSPSGLNERLDFRELTLRHDQSLTEYLERWEGKFQAESDMTDPACKFRASLLVFFTNYSRLVMYSFAFQQAFRQGIRPDDQIIVDKCYEAAKSVLLAFLDSLAPSGFERYAPDSHFIFVTFASAFLLKLLKPEVHRFLNRDQEEEIFQTIGRLIHTLNSNEIAIDDRHTPRLHARFLAGLLTRHKRDVSTSGRLHPQQPPPGQAVSVPSTTFGTQSTISPGPSQQVFSANPSQGSMPPGHGMGQMHAAPEPTVAPVEPIYQQEAAYAPDIGPLDVLDFSPDGNIDDEIFGGPLLALKSSSYWDNMMMPGFQWSEPRMHDMNYANANFNSGAIPVA